MIDHGGECYYQGEKYVQLLGEAGQECIHPQTFSVGRIENGAERNVSKPVCEVMSFDSCKLVSFGLTV